MTNNKNKKRDLTTLLLALVVVILINIVGSFVFYRFDLTSEKRYTLSDATKKLLEGLKDEVYVKVYLDGEFPAGFKRLRNETREMLDEFRAYSNDNVEYEFINPSENPDKKQQNEVFKQLQDKGLVPTNLEVKEENGTSQQIIWPGAIVSYHGHEVPWQLLQTQMGQSSEGQLNNSIQSLEYEFASCIRNLTTPIHPVVGFVEGHGELDTLATADIRDALSQFYLVRRVKINGKLDALDGLKAIVIAKPDTTFSEKDKFIIDQFIMKGGKVLWAVDMLNTSVDSLMRTGQTMSTPYELGIENMLFKYGVRINPNLVIDLQSSAIPVNMSMRGQQPRYELKPWMFHPLVLPTSKHPIVHNLDVIKMEYVSGMDTVDAPGVKKIILLQSSKYSKTLVTPVRVDMNYLHYQPDESKFTDSYQNLAVLLEGNFESTYKNHLTSNIQYSKDINYKDHSVKPTKMIVISDGDVIRNEVQYSSRKPYPLGYDKYTNQNFGNRNFLLNCVNYLCDDSGLISVRSRELTLRLLDKKKVKAEKLKWQLVNTVLPLALIFIFGWFYSMRRRKKYTK